MSQSIAARARSSTWDAGSPFVGRETELAELHQLLHRASIATVLGPPGVGKSRLARECVRRHYAGPAPIYVCDLAEATNAEACRSKIAHAIGIGAERADVASIGESLAELKAGLLVLDNVEGVGEPVARFLESWSRAAPGTTFLVTSRRRLGSEGEVLFDLGPLSLPRPEGEGALPGPEGEGDEGSEAVALFVDRAAALGRAGALTQDELRVVGRLVRELDGLPLAIELCAARIRVMTPAQMLDAVRDRFGLLGGSAEPSGRNLVAALEASWSLLEPHERSALAQCSVFAGTFDVSAAEGVVDLSSDERATVLETLSTLVDHSLVAMGPPALSSELGERRFFLYRSVRDFAAQKLSELGLEGGTRLRHAAHFARMGRAWAISSEVGAEAVVARRRLELEADNLLLAYHAAKASSNPSDGARALEAALALAQLFSERGPFALGLELLNGVSPAGPGIDPELFVRAHLARATMLMPLGQKSEAVRDAHSAVRLARALRNENLLAGALTMLGRALAADGHPTEATEHLKSALELCQRSGNRAREGHVALHLGCVAVYDDHFQDGAAHYRHARRLLEETGDLPREVDALTQLAFVEALSGKFADAYDHAVRALELSERLDNRVGRCSAELQVGVAAQELGRLDEARSRLERALGEARAIDHSVAAFARYYLGTCLLELGRFDEARDAIEAAARSHEQLKRRPALTADLACLAGMRASVDDLEGANALFARARGILRSLPSGERFYAALCSVHQGHLDLALARAAGAQGDIAGAARHRADASRRLERTPDDVRHATGFATRLLGSALATYDRESSPKGPSDVLAIAPDGAWFSTPGGPPITLGRRHSLRHLLTALARLRIDSPGFAMPVDQLARKVWLDEQLPREAAANRLRVAIFSLRRLGLGRLVVTNQNGAYLLDPNVPLSLAPAGSESAVSG